MHSVAGVITEGQKNRSFINVKTNEKVAFYSEGEKIVEKIGDYSISNKALNFANNAIKTSCNSKVIFIDEIGRLEREKKCLYKEISKLLKEKQKIDDKIIIMVIRDFLVQEILELLDIEPLKIWKIKEKPGEGLAKDIYEFILKDYKMREGGL